MRNDRLQLLLASFLMLFTELVLIRWAGAYIVYLSYFSNFVLLGSFLGIGLGFLRAHRGPDLFRWAPVSLAIFIGLVKGFPVQIDRGGSNLIFFGSLETKGLPTWVVLPFVFLAVAAIMMMIAYGVAQRFQKFSALEAYRLDIIGSLSGIIAYSLLAYFRVSAGGLDDRDRGPHRVAEMAAEGHRRRGRYRARAHRRRRDERRTHDLVAVLPGAVLRRSPPDRCERHPPPGDDRHQRHDLPKAV